MLRAPVLRPATDGTLQAKLFFLSVSKKADRHIGRRLPCVPDLTSRLGPRRACMPATHDPT